MQPFHLRRRDGVADGSGGHAGQRGAVARARRTDLAERGPLLGERACELEARDAALRDEDLAQLLAAFLLDLERTVELRVGDETALDEDLAERASWLAAFVGDLGKLGRLGRHVGGRGHDLERRLLRIRRRSGGIRALEVGPLLCEHARELDAGDAEVLNEDLPEMLLRLDLDRESSLELLLGDEAALEENGADKPRRDWIRRTHEEIHRQSLVRAIDRANEFPAAEHVRS